MQTEHLDDPAAPFAIPPDLIAQDWLEHYRAQAVRHLRERHAFNAAMIGVLERGDGSIEDFQAWSSAHDASTQAAGAALVCLAHLRNSEGTA